MPFPDSCLRLLLLIILFAGGSFFDWFPFRAVLFRKLVANALVAENPRLFLAPDLADYLHGAVGLHRNHDASDEKFIP